MDLLEIRQKFVELSGRYDLVTDTTSWSDNGANFFIQQGMKLLDMRIPLFKSVATRYYNVSAGWWHFTMTDVRQIRRVFIHDTVKRTELYKAEYADLVGWYPEPIASLTQGRPTHYCLSYLRAINIGDKGVLTDYIDPSTTGDTQYRGIVFMPITDKSYTLEVMGLFYNIMQNDSDRCHWSDNHPMLFVWGALYMLEVTYRNTEGASDWYKAIMDYTRELEFDLIEEDVVDKHEMREFEDTPNNAGI